MKRKLTMFLALFFIGIGFLTAQTQVRGTVVDDTGEPAIGATIQVQGTTLGTVTDIDGNFTLSAPADGVLVISYVGFQTQEVPVNSSVRIVLVADTELLDELIVTGYGTFRRSSFTGAASSVSTDKVQDVPAISLQSKLAGTVAGVQVTSTSGLPGAVESVRIRGMGSINASNDPLYVIDGVPMLTGDIAGFAYNQGGTSLLSTLNSNDIESMTVIKDAAAASLYGSRAANGVIVITTKKGLDGKTQFTARTDWGVSNRAINYRPILDGEARRDILHLGLENYAKYNLNNADPTGYADERIDTYAAEPWSGWTDWKDLLYKRGNHQNYEISARGGSARTKYYTSLTYLKQEGITLQSDYDRYTGTLNVSHQEERVTIDGSAMLSYSKQKGNSEGTSFSSPIMATSMTVSPSSYPYNEDGSYATFFPALNANSNPIISNTLNYDQNSVHRILTSLGVTWNIWDNLNLKEVLSYDFNQSDNRVWWDPRSGDGLTAKGVYQIYMMNRKKLNTQTQLTYNKSIDDLHNFDFLAGYETEQYNLDYTYSNGSNYPSYRKPEVTNAGTTRASSSYSEYRMLSYLSRLDYNYASRYYLSGSVRRDGTSRLSEESRWGNFWSVSGSWRLSQEQFMESLSHVISDAKIRASYGVNGTQPSAYYDYMGLFSFGFNYNGEPGSAETSIHNANLRWEKNHATNIGLDVTFLNRFSVSAEFYNRLTKDLIMEKPISAALGVVDNTANAFMLLNVGEMRNRGFELELKSNNIVSNDINWTTTLSLAHNRNKLLKLDGEQDEIVNATTDRIIHKVGEPYYSFYAYEYAGVDSETGKEMYYVNRETEGDRTTVNPSEAQRVVIGHAEPTIQGGLTNFFSWKYFDLNLTFTYSLGGQAYDDAHWIHSNGGTYHYYGNVPSYYKKEDMWLNPGDDAKLPVFMFGNTMQHSSRWLMSTDHLRLKNLTFGFTLPQNIYQNLGLTRVRAYTSASNLLTWKKDELTVDPEVPVNGRALFTTPAMRTITFGLEIGF